MAAVPSSRNPFRSNDITPNPTGTSSVLSAASSASNLGQRESQVEDRVSSESRPRSPVSTSQSAGDLNDVLQEEEPPAYTPGPDVYQGESTLECGPRRPFQGPPLHPSHQDAQLSGWSQIPSNVASAPQGRMTHSVWQNLAGQLSPPLPERRHVSQPNMSDFARDFYSSGTGEFRASSRRSFGDSETASDHGPSTGSHPSSTTSSNAAPGPPTTTPKPGHPLLRSGKVLLYPAGHQCDKCHNTGYKHYDPERPCKKCWNKFAVQYSAALPYAPSGDKQMQRPLPGLVNRRLSGFRNQSASASGQASSLRASLSGRPLVPGTTPAYPPSVPGAYPPPSAPSGRYSPVSSYPPRPASMYPPSAQHTGSRGPDFRVSYYPPPPGSVAYAAGDPRIGGRLCWRCDGSGTVSMLFGLDSSTCPTCNGIGRTFF
ncbi:hypothetical protein FISHEDRAFT_70436 [Fistulina hepatica ATCC 64428]|uniref:Uncharacterized protein n=1 Tax=Fistulina hepatica ATCC 64428 TaxID=1128425 RepID=A0A0D7AK30_9AGAR|nr:hypothetical protein FISHEDRAFT_70436 [Fistulina hepatica ATCC 64428]